MSKTLNEHIISSAFSGLQLQDSDGSMPEGHNGPWNHRDTKVRTTAHWAITFYKAYLLVKNQRFLDGAVRACDFLIHKDCRPYQATFFCRYSEPKRTQSNGLIGQVWAVEPLLYVGSALCETRYLDVAREVLMLHPYDYEMHGWKTVEIDGSVQTTNKTLNQQIWFCAMVSYYEEILGHQETELHRSMMDFMEHLSNIIFITEKGSFVHEFQPLSVFTLDILRQSIERRLYRKRFPYSLDYIATGYNSFVLYGLGMLREFTGANPVWSDPHLQNLVVSGIKFSGLKLWNQPLQMNAFAYGYNPVGIELAYANTIFADFMIKSCLISPTPSEWLESQFSRHFDYDKGLMVLNTSDPTLLAARIYEAVRLPEVIL